MNEAARYKLPSNPYKRSPIKNLGDLAGRAREKKAIRYYLSLTASGGNPHLALIGERGVGKTSLLNGAESIARDLKLLPVRLDMNELKAKSPGRFWHDLYQTLALSMVKAGCWGGEHGVIYGELLRMINSRHPGSIEKAVMQIPYVFSCHQESIDSFECPDALVVNDFNACLTELQSKELTGIAFLIDEADCLGRNVPLLQMFRNIFQTVEHCSLLLAGTEAVFPVLSEVFSPIPRQFHRVDVKPFAEWPETMELVLGPIPKDLRDIVAPERDVVRELHELCGGAPDEVQLYCHHMYRSVEDNSSKRMVLSPQVFREVLREYRSNSSANVDAVLNAIERLPDKLLFESKWLSRRNLTLEENIRVSVLNRELKLNETLSPEERAKVEAELTEGYGTLFDAGITELNDCIRLAGSPLTAGFWKSFVKVERAKRWTWDDDSFSSHIQRSITIAVGRACGAVGTVRITEGQDAVDALKTLRDGKTPAEFDEGMMEMIVSALFARDQKSAVVADVTLQIDSPAGKQTLRCRYLEKVGQKLQEEQIQQWIENHRPLLAGNDIAVVLTAFNRWELPSSSELQRLGRISGYLIPDVFGPTEAEQAVAKFEAGDIQDCMATFLRMLADKEQSQCRNNVAFCQLLTGDVAAGLENSTKAVADNYEPLFELNKAIAEFLIGNVEAARQSLRNALQQLHAPGSKFDNNAAYVLVLEPAHLKVTAHVEIPVDAAIMINLWRVGELTRVELGTELAKHYPEKVQGWLAMFNES